MIRTEDTGRLDVARRARPVALVRLHCNGTPHEVRIEHRTSLLTVLRDELGLTGTKRGCYRGQCGACTVLVDDRPRYACLTLAMECDGATVTTVEGLAGPDGQLSELQQAFIDHYAFQCGFCTPGMLMTATAMFTVDPTPDEETIRRWLVGNVCRCGSYRGIVRAIAHVAAREERT